MKRTTLFLIVPAIVALGACSSGSGSSGPGSPTGTGNGNPPSSGGNGNPGGNPGGGGDNGGGGGGGGGGGDNGGTTTQEYDVALAPSAEVPAVNDSTASGNAKFNLQQDGVTLAYDITHSVANATSAALHLGYPGEAGAVIHALTSVSGHMTGNVTLTADEVTSLTNGQIYLEIQSMSHPSGEVRGTLVSPGSTIFVATMQGAQVVPPVVVTTNGHASFILNATQDSVRYHVVTSASPTDVHINRNIGSLSGPVAFPLAQVAPQVDGTLQLAAADANDLQQGHWYVEVVTSQRANGELRGQIIREGEILGTALMAGINEVPPVSTQATGGAQFIVSADRKSLRYEAVVNGIIPTGAEIDNAPQGQRGSMLYPLTLNQTGAKGTVSLTANDMGALNNSGLAVNVASASNAGGELRGQIIVR